MPKEKDDLKEKENDSSKAFTADDLAKEFKEHSVAEFFKKNKQMLGLVGKIRTLTTIVHEYVTNSLDACEEARILPDIEIQINELGPEYYEVIVKDNGPADAPPNPTPLDPYDVAYTYGTIHLVHVPYDSYIVKEEVPPPGYLLSPDQTGISVGSQTPAPVVYSNDDKEKHLVPTLSQWGIIAMAGVFGILLVWTGKRRLARKNS